MDKRGPRSGINDQVPIVCVTGFQAKRDAPVLVHGHGPNSVLLSFQLVQTKTRQIDVLRGRSGIQYRQDILDFLAEGRVHSLRVASEESLERLLAETPDHLRDSTVT